MEKTTANVASTSPNYLEDKKVKVEKIRALCKDFYGYVENLKSSSSKEFDLNEVRNLENKGTHYEHAYNADERRFTPVW